MLYGDESFRNRILCEVTKIEEEQNFKVIYGAMVGSISKGLQYCNSDYDTRFLYVNKNFPQEIIIPDSIEEEQIIYRKYYEDSPYDKIPFWELSSFLQFLINPMIDNIFSVGLYNVVGWTFLSPYTFDPYGIQNKIISLIQKIFYKDYYVEYHKNLLENFNLEDDMILTKDYLHALHAALSIDWAYEYNEYSPVYIRTLLSLRPELEGVVETMLQKAQKEDRKFRYSTSNRADYSTHCKIYTTHNELVDMYLQRIKEKVSKFTFIKMQHEEQSDKKCQVQKMYNIIDKSLRGEEKLRYVNMM